MARRINEYVLAGELRNTTRNRVYGWIEFAPDWGIDIELNGNLAGQFCGRHFRFRIDRPASQQVAVDDMPELITGLTDRQIGMIGEVVLHERKIPTIPVKEFYERSKRGESPPVEIKDVLYLEWFGPNGRVVAEIIDPRIEFVTEEPRASLAPPLAEPLPHEDNTGCGPSITRVELNDDGDPIVEHMDFSPAPENEYGLFDSNLDEQLCQSLSGSDEPLPSDDTADEHVRERSWDEVIPGIDPETKALYEQWDEVYGGEKDEMATDLFDPPLRLPPTDSVTTDAEAQPLLTDILSRLAMLNIAFDMCEHATPLTAYRCLVNEILPTAHVHPNLAATDIVQHYSMYESCAECAAEFEAEYECGKPKDPHQSRTHKIDSKA